MSIVLPYPMMVERFKQKDMNLVISPEEKVCQYHWPISCFVLAKYFATNMLATKRFDHTPTISYQHVLVQKGKICSVM